MVWPLAASAQHAAKIPRIGYLGGAFLLSMSWYDPEGLGGALGGKGDTPSAPTPCPPLTLVCENAGAAKILLMILRGN